MIPKFLLNTNKIFTKILINIIQIKNIEYNCFDDLIAEMRSNKKSKSD